MDHKERKQVTVLVDEYLEEHGVEESLFSVQAFVEKRLGFKVKAKDFGLALAKTKYARGLVTGVVKAPSEEELFKAGRQVKAAFK